MAPLVTFTFTNDYVPSIDVLLKFGGGFAILFVVSFLISRLHKKDRELSSQVMYTSTPVILVILYYSHFGENKHWHLVLSTRLSTCFLVVHFCLR